MGGFFACFRPSVGEVPQLAASPAQAAAPQPPSKAAASLGAVTTLNPLADKKGSSTFTHTNTPSGDIGESSSAPGHGPLDAAAAAAAAVPLASASSAGDSAFTPPPGSGSAADREKLAAVVVAAEPVPAAVPPALQLGTGATTASHSLKLSSSHTLCQSNLQLCRPEDLLGDIKDLSFIGNGSFAAVFKGLWQGAKVAVKFVVSDGLNQNSVTLRESVLSQLLSHPNVVQTYTTRVAVMDDASLQRIHGQSAAPRNNSDSMRFVSGDGFGDPRHKASGGVISVSNILLQLQVKPAQYVAVVIMEYADKGTLQEAIYKRQIFKESPRWNKRIAARALFRTAREIALGMQHLHSSNILHGDLKPGNVLLTSARVDRRGFIAKLADFGLSHVAPGPIATNTWGTLRYMAPEHFQGTMSRATDVFAFGMLLWEMVTGKKPYENMTQGEVIQSVSQGLRPQWPPDCFPHLEYLGKRCIAHNPADRPSFSEIVKELEDMEVMLRELLQATRESGGVGLTSGAGEGSFSQSQNVNPAQRGDGALQKEFSGDL